MPEMEKETEETDIGTSISSLEIDADNRQKDEASGKTDEENGLSIISDNEEEEEKEKETEEEEEAEKKREEI